MRLRAVLVALLAGAATLVLAACGSIGSGSADDSGPSGSRTITDAQGVKVKVPNYPRRVVTLSEPTLDGALALGLRPIATTSGRGRGGVSPYLGKQARGITNVGVLGRPNLEHVAALEPDLILIDGTAVRDGALVDRLRRVAPTVYVSQATAGWRAAFEAQAAALNRQTEGTHLLDELDSRVAEVRAALGANAGATISVVRRDGAGLPSASMRGLAVGRVLEDLGLRLKAARADHVVRVDGSAWTSAGGPIAARVVVDDIAGALTSG